MNIREEYDRLVKMTSTKKGFREFEKLWLEKITDKVGVFGFAFDLKTGKTKESFDHQLPFYDLISELQKEGEISSIDEGMTRVKKGHLAKLDGWKFPFIHVSGWLDPENEAIEEFLLENKHGLPLKAICEMHLQIFEDKRK